MSGVKYFKKIDEAANWILDRFESSLSLAMPLGLGKPNQLINTIYQKAKARPSYELKIFTALSLELPHSDQDLQRRFLEPFKERHFGKDYPELQYTLDITRGQLPPNIGVYEFYFQAGKALGLFEYQRNYISLNYTHVVPAVYERGIQLFICMISKNPKTGASYSLSCNPDVTLDLVDYYRKNGRPLKVVGVIHPDLPFMAGDAEVDSDFFDAIVDSPEVNHQLFALPHLKISDQDYLVGLQASLLVQDGGTLQVGIGSLGDALIYCLCLRQEHPDVYQKLTTVLIESRFQNSPHRFEFHQKPFEIGLYGTSEMVMDGFMHLRNAGILKREVFDQDEKKSCYLHGAFFLGSKDFYRWMGKRFEEGDAGLSMTRVSKVNDLYDPHELAIRRQRVKARFFNMCMDLTVLGGVAADTHEDGQVVSGVGGQYNFVAMSHELPDSHAVIMSRSTHGSGSKRKSNVLWAHPQLTIPRHLRDVFITEYGVAFTRGKTDEETICAIVEIADSKFQDDLIKTAVKNGKLSSQYRVPEWASQNRGENISELLAPFKKEGFFSPFPFGSDFTPVEERLLAALSSLKELQSHPLKIPGVLLSGMRIDAQKYEEELTRMDLFKPKNRMEWSYQKLLLAFLKLPK